MGAFPSIEKLRIKQRVYVKKIKCTNSKDKEVCLHELHLTDIIKNNSYLSLLVTTQLEVLASLDGQHSLGSAVGLHTLEPQDNFLCSFSLRTRWIEFINPRSGSLPSHKEVSSYLFPENRLRLTPVAALLSVVSPLTCTCTVQSRDAIRFSHMTVEIVDYLPWA